MRLLVCLRDALWGLPTVALLSGFGLYFTAKLGFFSPAALYSALKNTFFAPSEKGSGKNLSALSALSTALGGTVGVGSISGVALAVNLGGAGCVFWMWVCSFLGVGLKYAEVALSHSRRRSTSHGYAGGAMYCLEDLGKRGLARAFAVLTALSAAAGGSVVQAGAVSETLEGALCGRTLCALTTALAVGFIISGGRRFIAAFNTAALPLFSALFSLLCLAVLLRGAGELPRAIHRIFAEAFGFRQAAGGVGAAVMMRVGCTRGTFSNEAGMGSSPISYCAGSGTDSHRQGLWGVGEVLVDGLVGTLTALCLLCTGESGLLAVFAQSFGRAGEVFYIAALCVFALAAVVSWCFYGEEAVLFLFPHGGPVLVLFRALVVLGAFVGALLPESGAFAAADVWGALMLFPNLYLLYKSRGDIIALAKPRHRTDACKA